MSGMSNIREQAITLHLHAPPKPPAGAACNGCGVCCAAEPCPLGMLLSRRRRGACVALRWNEAAGRYHCDVLAHPSSHLPWLPKRWARGLVARWIAAGQGCDCDAELL